MRDCLLRNRTKDREKEKNRNCFRKGLKEQEEGKCGMSETVGLGRS